MKRQILSACFLLLCTVAFASGVEGKWKATIETDNGPYTFYADFAVEGEALTGELSSMDGSVVIYNGKIKGNALEYFFDLDYNPIKHEGKLVDGELKMKSTSDNGDMEFTMTRAEE